MPKLTNKQLVDYELSILMNIAKAIGTKDCRSKAKASTIWGVIVHLFRYRHITHKCGCSRPFGSFHEGMHRCARGACEFMWLNSYGE